MNLEMLRDVCLAKPGTTEEFPFDEMTLVFKVMGKIYAITGLDAEEPTVNLKCNPERAIELRENHDDIIPGYHMNKKHWNTIYLEGELSDALIIELIQHSYEQVVNKMTIKQKEALARLRLSG